MKAPNKTDKALGVPPEKSHFTSLDSLRGIAALLVVLLHINWLYPLFFLRPVRHSYLMVDFFFVLSGFVIAYNYLGNLKKASGLAEFMWLRFWRLYPLHFVMLLVFLAIEVLKYIAQEKYGLRPNFPPFRDNNLHGFFTNILLIQSLNTNNLPTFNVPSWSISVEFYAYLLYGLVVLIFGIGKWFWTASVGIMIASLLVITALPRTHLGIDWGSDWGFFRCTSGFFLGVVIFLLYRFVGVFRRTEIMDGLAILSIALIVLLLAMPSGYQDLAIYPFVGLLIFALASAPKSRMNQMLNARPLVWLGRVSYSVYMIHYAVVWGYAQILRVAFKIPQITVDLGANATRNIPYTTQFVGSVTAFCAICTVLILSHYSFYLIEEPCRQWSKRASRGWGIKYKHETFS